MISFVIPALESDAEYLYDCMASIVDEISVNGTGTDEVILVVKLEKSIEGGFRAKIKERYSELDGSLIRTRCGFSDGNRSAARNIGLKMAENNIITFLDSDTVIGRGFITATVNDFEKGYGYVNYSARPLDEEVENKLRLFFYARFMNLNQWFYTRLGIYRPYGFCMSVKKDFCESVAENDEIFLKSLAGYGEDAEFGRRYKKYCDRLGARGKYEKTIIVKTSFREWYKHGLIGGGVRMIQNTWKVPYRKKPIVGNWK